MTISYTMVNVSEIILICLGYTSIAYQDSVQKDVILSLQLTNPNKPTKSITTISHCHLKQTFQPHPEVEKDLFVSSWCQNTSNFYFHNPDYSVNSSTSIWTHWRVTGPKHISALIHHESQAETLVKLWKTWVISTGTNPLWWSCGVTPCWSVLTDWNANQAVN